MTRSKHKERISHSTAVRRKKNMENKKNNKIQDTMIHVHNKMHPKHC
jgi:hypothetical protein